MRYLNVIITVARFYETQIYGMLTGNYKCRFCLLLKYTKSKAVFLACMQIASMQLRTKQFREIISYTPT